MARFLVIDDEQEVCEALQSALSTAGYAVETCTNGTKGIELFRRERADLVFCDLKLPDVDGLAVLRAMKGIDPWATVIVMTAYGSMEAALHAMRLGAYDFLEKPFTYYQVQQVAKRALGYHHQLRQLTLLQGKPGSAADIPTQLMELEQLRADFLSLIFKELRAPLGLLSTEMTLLRQGSYGSWDDPLKKEFLQQLGKVHTRLTRLLLESFALFKAHEQQVVAALKDVRFILQELLQEAQTRCEERQITLKVSLPPHPTVGLIDAEKISFILRELLDNAIRNTPTAPPGDTIEVELISQPQGFQFLIRDTGIGMVPEEEREWKKVGLGLALADHYLKLLKGTMIVESQLGHGTHFTVTIPWWNLHRP